MLIIRLFLIFAKIGAFSIGGGYAMLPFIQREIIDNNHYLNLKEFSDILAISQMTPGPIAINSATFVGYKIAGVLGSVAATLGIVLPSFIMIIIIASFFVKFYDKKEVKAAFSGIRPAVLGLLAAAAYSVTITNVIDLKSIFIFILSFGILFIKKMDPIIVLIISAVLGIILY
ncbi:chromate transporter [Caloramator quimbayensis]|uniref:Chromate transporter n=1 Tax=Caloramator quimbayensis TaxID=1147123 RepID=A0A1T4WFD4_9CLOT|nr:chromate transporter [Caloramator quimbayensis]SKA75859.1 chromate transporter [Caloramator quimbayensis]